MPKPDRDSANDQLGTILDSITDGVFTVDNDWRITSFNRAAEQITGIDREEAVGRPCWEVFRASICERDCALAHTRQTGTPIVNQAVYIIKSDGSQLPISISTAVLKDEQGKIIGGVETFRDLSLVETLRKELSRQYTFADIISKSPAMQRIFEILPDVATSDSTVLIEGESGTGKELLARAIHNLSVRQEHRFVAVNCGALPDTLLESELFGYKKGAFTGAEQDKPGRFALAEQGTLFLDEIGDVSPALQTRLLRVLEEKTYEPLGATESEQADVRVVTATNRPVAQLVQEGAFRQDLYYRVNVVRMELPPLRARREDIPLLVEHFISRFNRLRGKDVSGLADETLDILLRHDYPGNVRELENIIEHAFVLCRGGMIQPRHLPGALAEQVRSQHAPAPPANSLAQTERAMIIQALEQNQWNRSATAQALGIHKSTLFRKIRRMNIDLPEIDGRSKRS